MLCRLLLLRHAKSSPAEGEMTDHERPLNEKGSNDAQKMGKKIADKYKPKLVLCSNSKRTMETFEGMSSWFSDVKVIHTPKLYNSDVDSYIDCIHDLEIDLKTLMLIGHNPTLEDMVQKLSSHTLIMKPAHLAVLELEADSWDIALSKKGHWKLVEVIMP